VGRLRNDVVEAIGTSGPVGARVGALGGFASPPVATSEVLGCSPPATHPFPEREIASTATHAPTRPEKTSRATHPVVYIVS